MTALEATNLVKNYQEKPKPDYLHTILKMVEEEARKGRSYLRLATHVFRGSPNLSERLVDLGYVIEPSDSCFILSWREPA